MNKFLKVLKEIFYSFLWIGVLIIIADLVSKQVVLHTMKIGDKISLIGGFLDLEYKVNPGMAFGINFLTAANPIANQIIFISISVIGAALLIFIIARNYKKLNSLEKTSLGLMAAGCLGNLIQTWTQTVSWTSLSLTLDLPQFLTLISQTALLLSARSC